MKKEVVDFIAKCLECQKVKAKHRHPTGFLQPLPIPEWKWEVVVITEILSAHGYNNSTSSNNNEVIHGLELIPPHSKR